METGSNISSAAAFPIKKVVGGLEILENLLIDKADPAILLRNAAGTSLAQISSGSGTTVFAGLEGHVILESKNAAGLQVEIRTHDIARVTVNDSLISFTKDLDLNGNNIVNPGIASGFGRVFFGSYTSDGNINRAIAHGMPAKPKIVFIFTPQVSNISIVLDLAANNIGNAARITGSMTVTQMDATNFYVGNASDTIASGNWATPTLVTWMALL